MDLSILEGVRAAPPAGRDAVVVVIADPAETLAYRALRREVFVGEQGLFDADDHDALEIGRAHV